MSEAIEENAFVTVVFAFVTGIKLNLSNSQISRVCPKKIAIEINTFPLHFV